MQMLDDATQAEYQRLASQHGVYLNEQSGIYIRGKSYDFIKKLQVAAAYNVAKTENGGKRPNISGIQRACQASRAFIRKIEQELCEHGRVLKPSEIFENRDVVPTGPGARTLDEIDAAVILFLYLEEPSRCLSSYTYWLELHTGTVVSPSTISRFLHHAFPPFKGGLCRPNLVPFNKFRPSNIERAYDYLDIISEISPHRIKFGDEKYLKGNAIFNRKVRRDPFNGNLPPAIVTLDFRNRYTMTGFCSIDPSTTKTAVWCSLHDDINDADQFVIELEYAIHAGFFSGGDVLVLDNDGVHTGKENTVLEDYLWKTYGIFLLFLPMMTPEWNPMEQVWKCLVQKLKKLSLNRCLELGNYDEHVTARAAIGILSNTTYDEVKQFYVGSGIIRED